MVIGFQYDEFRPDFVLAFVLYLLL